MRGKKSAQETAQSIRLLSSGTIAGLIDNSDYHAIDRKQAEYAAIVERSGRRFESWVPAILWVINRERYLDRLMRDIKTHTGETPVGNIHEYLRVSLFFTPPPVLQRLLALWRTRRYTSPTDDWPTVEELAAANA